MKKPKLLTEQDLAQRLQVSRRTLQRWRSAGTGPEFQRMGDRLIRYQESAVTRWQRSNQAVAA